MSYWTLGFKLPWKGAFRIEMTKGPVVMPSSFQQVPRKHLLPAQPHARSQGNMKVRPLGHLEDVPGATEARVLGHAYLKCHLKYFRWEVTVVGSTTELKPSYFPLEGPIRKPTVEAG